MVKSIISFISRPLTHILNGDFHDIHNYRPISVLPCFSKILERLMYNRLSKFLSDFHILFDFHFGFRNKHSTDLALVHFLDHLNSSLTQKLSAVGVFIDLSKAFDTTDHSIILSKLDHYGIRGISLQWFADYLHNRKQCTSINKTYSNLLTINHGVPQGSILGPLLFLLYVNDLHHSYFTLFADDTTIL